MSVHKKANPAFSTGVHLCHTRRRICLFASPWKTGSIGSLTPPLVPGSALCLVENTDPEHVYLYTYPYTGTEEVLQGLGRGGSAAGDCHRELEVSARHSSIRVCFARCAAGRPDGPEPLDGAQMCTTPELCWQHGSPGAGHELQRGSSLSHHLSASAGKRSFGCGRAAMKCLW